MRPDPVVTLPRAVDEPETGRSEPTEPSGLRMATGVYAGVAVGLTLWLLVLGVAWLVTVLA